MYELWKKIQFRGGNAMKMIPVTSCADCDKREDCNNYITNNVIRPECPLDDYCDTKEVE